MTDIRKTIERIAFGTYRNVNVGVARRFAALGISPSDFFSQSADRLGTLCCLKHDYFLDSRRQEALEAAQRELAFMDSGNIGFSLVGDEDFPAGLADCDDAPALLFTLGDCRLNDKRTVAIVGTRHATAYGIEMTTRIVEDLAQSVDNIVIISGLAYGIDIAAHRAALNVGVPTGAILAHGLSTIYPSAHRNDARRIVSEGGFIATEYTSRAPIHKGNFLARNRIIAGLADVTIVVESDTRGGAMTTARIAAAYNREVMALPGRTTDIYSRGCNELLARREASVVRDASDIAYLMGWPSKHLEGKQTNLPILTDEQTRIVGLLNSHPDATVNDLCALTGLPISHLSALLFQMEIDNILTSVPGGRYQLLLC